MGITMSDWETAQLEEIEKIISRKLKPIYWLVGLMTAMFAAAVGPISADVRSLSIQQSKCITSEESYKNFLPKEFYHQLQKDEHITDVEAIQNPHNAANLYLRNNSHEAEQLEIRFRGGW